jgi:hypothetical protein
MADPRFIEAQVASPLAGPLADALAKAGVLQAGSGANVPQWLGHWRLRVALSSQVRADGRRRGRPAAYLGTWSAGPACLAL